MRKIYLLFTIVMFAALCGCTKKENKTDTTAEQPAFVEGMEEYVEEGAEEEDYNNEDYYDEDEISVVSSSDGTICVYSKSLSGSVYFGWSKRYTVKDGDSIYTFDGLPDWESEVSSINNIYSLPHPKRHLYLFDAYFREWGSMGYQYFVTFERIGHDLKRVNILRDDDGHSQCEIGFEYNTPDYYFRFARSMEDGNLYQWDEKNATLYYPVLIPDSYFITDKFVRYVWDGQMMTPTSDTVANPRLYASLQDYALCFQHTKVGSIQVRVDSLADGRLRYTAWKREQDISTKPDLILYGKTVGNEYHFYNGTFTYVVTKENIPEVRLYNNNTTGQLGTLQSTFSED